MAIYKLFPSKTTTLYSNLPNKNTGLDEILEVGQYNNGFEDCISRSLIQFDSNEIESVLSKIPSGSVYDASLKLFVANETKSPLDYKIIANPLTQRWDMGTGKFKDKYAAEGANWNYSDVIQSEAWNGGAWNDLIECSQSFSYRDSKDIDMDITPIVGSWLTTNHGLILNSDSIPTNLKYFSGNTHTIYPACLELGWDDSTHNSGSLEEVSISNVRINIGNLKESYEQHSTQQFRVNVRDVYPARKFQTTSVYLNNKILPYNSFWSIKDIDTEEVIVDFSENTRISSDPKGNFFKVYMNGLQPERYYKLMIMFILGTEEVIVDQSFNFKVIK